MPAAASLLAMEAKQLSIGIDTTAADLPRPLEAVGVVGGTIVSGETSAGHSLVMRCSVQRLLRPPEINVDQAEKSDGDDNKSGVDYKGSVAASITDGGRSITSEGSFERYRGAGS